MLNLKFLYTKLNIYGWFLKNRSGHFNLIELNILCLLLNDITFLFPILKCLGDRKKINVCFLLLFLFVKKKPLTTVSVTIQSLFNKYKLYIFKIFSKRFILFFNLKYFIIFKINCLG